MVRDNGQFHIDERPVIEFGWFVLDTDLLYFIWNGGNTTREHSPLDRITHRFFVGAVQNTLENVRDSY